MLDFDNVPTTRAGAVIPAGSPLLLAWDVTGAVYQGPCPACQKTTVVNRNIATCEHCKRELMARVVRPTGGAAYLRLEF